jgi:hypothetical protein
VIYALQGQYGGAVKIGYTRDEWTLMSRIETLQTGNPQYLNVRGTILDDTWCNSGWFRGYPGSQSQELTIHNMLQDCRLAGEWFWPTPELRELFPDVIRGSARDKELVAQAIAYLQGSNTYEGRQELIDRLHDISQMYLGAEMNDLIRVISR